MTIQRMDHVAREILNRLEELEEAAMPSEPKATYAYEAFTREAQQALLRAQALAEEAQHLEIGVGHLMAAVAEDLATSPDAIMRAGDFEASGSGRPKPGPVLASAIAGAFRAAGVAPPGSAGPGVGTRHLALGCLDTPDGRAIADRLGLIPA